MMHPGTQTVARQKRIEAYERNPKLCLLCLSPISYGKQRVNRFCSSNCAAKYNNPLRGPRRALRLCLHCGKTIQSKKYCSQQCRAAYLSALWISDWLSGNFKHVAEHTHFQIRRYLINEANGKCTLCGWGQTNPFTGKIPLNVDHIDGDCRNNARENLRILCPNCHSLTPTYGFLNKGNGRKKRYNKP